MDWNSYSLFNTDRINIANSKIGSNYSFMFVFANYNPKKASFKNPALNFHIAITNAYALYVDCGNYIQKGWHDTLRKQRQWSPNQCNDFKEMIQFISCCRSLFCHNQNPKTTTKNKQVEVVVEYLKNIIMNDGSRVDEQVKSLSEMVNSKVFGLNFDDDTYIVLTKAICERNEEFIKQICRIFEYLPTTRENIRKVLIDEWSKSVAEWYSTSNSVLNTVTWEYYTYYNKIQKLGTFKSWRMEGKKQWEDQEKIKDTILSLKMPAVPEETLYEMIQRYPVGMHI